MIKSLTMSKPAEAEAINPERANWFVGLSRWPQTKGYDGRVRVAVPKEELVCRDNLPYSPLNNPVRAVIARLEAELPEKSARVAILDRELAGMGDALIEARARSDAAELALAIERARAGVAHAPTVKAIGTLATLWGQIEAALAGNRLRPWWRRRLG